VFRGKGKGEGLDLPRFAVGGKAKCGNFVFLFPNDLMGKRDILLPIFLVTT